MIKSHQIIQLLIETYPDFRKTLIEAVEYWLPEKGPISPHAVLSILGHLVVEKFLAGDYDQSEELFNLIEQMISEGDGDVKNAATTCFLENLQNISSSDDNTFESDHFISLLGPKSKTFCRDYDKMTGAVTPGLEP